jgi:hypothetical protein
MRAQTQTILAALAAVAIGSGCASSSAPKVDAMYQAYLAQPRTYQAVQLRAATGKSMDIHVTNVGEFILESPLNPLSARSADPSTAQATIAAIERLAAIGIGAWAIESIANEPAQDPTVVTTEKLVPVEGAVP